MPSVRDNQDTGGPPQPGTALGRRAFLGLGGVSVAGIFIAGCGSDDEPAPQGQTDTQTQTEMQDADLTLDFGEPTAVLNYAYALEQLEAAFYAEVNANMFSDASNADRKLLEDIGAHEIIHREFFKRVLGDDAIPALEPNFGDVDFGDRMSVLTTAQTFENLGVAAYNGAAQYIDISGPLGAVPLMAAGDIVSVEARHASTITAILEAGRGGFSVGAFDEAMAPSDVVSAAQPFIRQQIAVRNVPNQQGG